MCDWKKGVIDYLKKDPDIDIQNTFDGEEAIVKYLSFEKEASVQRFTPEERNGAFFVVFRLKHRVHYEYIAKFFIGHVNDDKHVSWGFGYKEDKWDTVRLEHGL